MFDCISTCFACLGHCIIVNVVILIFQDWRSSYCLDKEIVIVIRYEGGADRAPLG